jgi:hypothetical protein
MLKNSSNTSKKSSRQGQGLAVIRLASCCLAINSQTLRPKKSDIAVYETLYGIQRKI